MEYRLNDPNVVVEGSIMRHKPTKLTVYIKRPGTPAQLREAHSTLMGLVRFARTHDDRSIAS